MYMVELFEDYALRMSMHWNTCNTLQVD